MKTAPGRLFQQSERVINKALKKSVEPAPAGILSFAFPRFARDRCLGQASDRGRLAGWARAGPITFDTFFNTLESLKKMIE
jgi:hypothetical protein